MSSIPGSKRAAGGRPGGHGSIPVPAITLAPGQEAHYVLLLGVEDSEEAVNAIWDKYHSWEQVQAVLDETRSYWKEKVNVSFPHRRPGL